MINGFYGRVIISAASTTILHASIFYTLNEIKEPRAAAQKTLEIALVDAPKIEKKEAEKPKEQPRPKQNKKPKEPPKKVIKQKSVKPERIIKQEPITEPEKTLKPIEEVEKQMPIEPIKTARQKPLEPIQPRQDKALQEPAQEQKATSKTDPTILEQYLFKVREKIQENLRYPPLAKRLKLEGESIVGFEILSNGSVDESSIETKNSSGHKSLDRQAIDTILSVSPFDTPPAGGALSIIVPVAFNLK